MVFRIPRRVRAAAAVVAVAAYALPLALGLLAEAGHAAQHVREGIQEHRRVAAALGVAHLADTPASGSRHGGFVHTHDGSTHAHDHATGALLRAAQHADDNSGSARMASLELVSHLPGVFAAVLGALGPEVAPVATAPSLTPSVAPSPLLPPPRA